MVTDTSLDSCVVHYFVANLLPSLLKFAVITLPSCGLGRILICGQMRLQENDVCGHEHSFALPVATPVPPPCGTPGFLSSCRFAHISSSSGRVCTWITFQYLYWPNKGSEGFSAQKDDCRAVVCTPTSRGDGDLASKIGFCSYRVSRSTCSIVFK